MKALARPRNDIFLLTQKCDLRLTACDILCLRKMRYNPLLRNVKENGAGRRFENKKNAVGQFYVADGDYAVGSIILRVTS